MMALLAQIRDWLGFGESLGPVIGKRDRAVEGEDFSDDDSPAIKRIKRLSNTAFPRIMPENDEWEQRPRPSNVRYVPIQLEGFPSTSTPEMPRSRVAPVARVGATDIRPAPRHSRPVMHSALDDDPEISWIEPKSTIYNKKSSRASQEKYVLIDDDDEDEQDENDSDIVYVKRVEPRMNKFFVSRQPELDLDQDSPRQRFRINRNFSDRRIENISPRPKFKSPAGITKSYRPKPISQIPKWMQPIRSSSLGHIPLRNRLSQINGNSRSAIMEAFNLEEKKNYQELIRRMSARAKPSPVSKPIEVIDLANEYSSLRATQRSQKQSLDQLNLTAQRISSSTINETRDHDKEYDPITVAALNSSDSEVELVNSSDASTTSSVRVQPVNSLKSSQEGCRFLGRCWASDVSTNYRKKIKDKVTKSRDFKTEINLIEEVNREQSIAQLQRDLRDDLKLTDSEELVEEEEVEIPQLTPEQEKIVDRALGPGPSGQMLVEKFGLRIHRRDLQTLAGLNWLNDEVINFYMNLITQRSTERKDLPKVYTANTFFYPKLMQSGQAGLRRWTRKVDIFAHDLMVIPVHLNVHWCVCLVELDKKRVAYLDSMGGPNNACLEAVLQYLRDEHQDKKGQPLDHSGWRKEQLKDIPQQMNGSDCGMFACTFAEYAARRAPFSFSQTDMPRLRRKAAYEILQGKLIL